MTYPDLQEACRIYGLGERATLREIKERHRQLVRQHHPDAGGGCDPGAIRQINAAHRILSEYVNNYRFSFSEAEFLEQNPDERLRRQFMNDPLWGKG